MPPTPTPAPNEAAIRAEGAELYDLISIPALATVPPEDMQQYRRMFAEGYLHGYANGSLKVLQDLQTQPTQPQE